MRASSAAARLKEIVSQKSCPCCLVLTSPDRTRRERALGYLLDNFIGKRASLPVFSFAEQGRGSINHFLANAAAPSLFEPQQFVLLRSVEKAKAAELEPVSALIAKQLPGVHVIIVGEGLPNSANFKKAIEKHATHIAFEELKGAELSRWVEKELKGAGVSQPPDEVVGLILSLASDDADAISRLVEKLSLYLDGAAPTVGALRELEPGRSLASDFDLAEALLSTKRAGTETLIQQLIAQGSSPFMLMGLLTKTFSTLYRIRAALDRGQPQGDLKNDLGLSPWLLSKYIPLARQLSLAQISSILESLLEADFRLKDRSIGPAATLSSVAALSASTRSV